MGDEKTAAFLLGIFLFLRFVAGSAVHLWWVYIKPSTPELPGIPWMLFDSGSLLIFGLIAVRISYSNNSVEEFLWWNVVLLTAALLWCTVTYFRDKAKKALSGNKTFRQPWLIINLAQGALAFGFLVVFMAEWDEKTGIDCHSSIPPEMCIPGTWIMWLLVVVYAAALAIDVGYTLHRNQP